MGAERPPREDEWTLAEGVRSTLGFLGVRLLYALPLAVLLEGGVLAPMSRLPNVALLTILFGLVLGMAIGTVIAWGLIRRVRFTGWIPLGLAAGAAAVAVFGGYGLAALWNPIEGDFTRALSLGVLAIGAGAAVYRFAGLD